MAKIITVWGNPGSGKSTFCSNLSKVLSKNKQKSLIISGDLDTPMLPLWIPEPIDSTYSIGNVLSALEINTPLIAEKITILKSYPFIGVMGYASGDTPLTYPELKVESVKTLFLEASKLVDYIIIDCPFNVTNYFTPIAIEMAHVVVRILTPDLRGIHYLGAQKPLLKNEKFQYDHHFTFAGMARPFHALDEFKSIVGGLDGLLPYTKEIEQCGTFGGMFQSLKYCNSRYQKCLQKVKNKLNP